MRIVNSYLSKDVISDEEAMMITKTFKCNYEEKVEVQSFKYEDRRYYELDVDILDITYTKESIHKELMKLIRTHEGVLAKLDGEVFIIVANDDTDSEIIMFENDNSSTINIGLLISKKSIGNKEPYFQSKECYAYLDFDFVSFDTIF